MLIFQVYKIKSLLLLGVLLVLISLSKHSVAQEVLPQSKSESVSLTYMQEQSFASIYVEELGSRQKCSEQTLNVIKFCFAPLRNDGNAPYILLPKGQAKAVVVLFHGLSDSPFFVQSVARDLQKQGYLVIAPLTPGHGKKVADADMEDPELLSRWYKHVDAVMNFAHTFNLPVVVGGFSTGGAFASYYTINHPDKVTALLLFSGALELPGSAEAMSKIWGMKTLASWLDGEYEANGPHPYKYPSVASYSGLVLMDVIKDIRNLLETTQIEKPIFAAHSMADRVTLFSGIESLTSKIEGEHTMFKIDESYDLCHADVPMSAVQIINLKFDKSKVNTNERCAVPKPNPLHSQMLLMLNVFLSEHIKTVQD